MYRIIIGHIGSDAGFVYIGSDGKIHRVPGWNPEAIREVSAALTIIRDATKLRTPGLAEAAIKSVMEFTQKELATHLKEGGGEGAVLVLSA